MAVSETPVARTYGNWRKPMSVGLLGLGMIGTVILMTCLIVVIVILMVFGILAAAVVFAVLVVGLGSPVLRDRHGRSGLQLIAARTSGLGCGCRRDGARCLVDP